MSGGPGVAAKLPLCVAWKLPLPEIGGCGVAWKLLFPGIRGCIVALKLLVAGIRGPGDV